MGACVAYPVHKVMGGDLCTGYSVRQWCAVRWLGDWVKYLERDRSNPQLYNYLA